MANILLEPSFESVSWATYWPSYTSSGAHTDTQDATTATKGGSGLKVTATAGVTDGGVNQRTDENPLLALLPKGTWLFSGWVKTGANVTNAHCLIRETSGFTVAAGIHVNTANQGWAYFQGYFASDGLKNYDILAGLGSYGGASDGTAWFDDINLEMIHSGYDRIPNQYRNGVVGDGMGRSESWT